MSMDLTSITLREINSYTYLGPIVNKAKSLIHRINSPLQGYSPLALVAATVAAVYGIMRWREMVKGRSAADFALQIPQVRQKYEREMSQHIATFQEKTRKTWEPFGPPFLRIPETGMSSRELMHLIHFYAEKTLAGLEGRHFSGTIYSQSLERRLRKSEMRNGDDGDSLEELYTEAFRLSYLWNSLHGSEFPIGTFLDYQVVQMVAESFGGKSQEVMGLVTSGGTESLMNAARAYRNWGRRVKGHAPGESIIIASDSIHAALLKAEMAYDIKVLLIPSDETGVIRLEELSDLILDYKNKVVALFASAPNYPTGKMDPIWEMAQMAEASGIGLHVDACLGAFVGNFLLKKGHFLNATGVTSLSADTHKNGLAPKGSSVLIGKGNLPGGENLIFYSVYPLPHWKGGVYGTPKNSGSQSCTPSLHALLGMLATGKNGYREIAEAIHEKTLQMAEVIKRCKGLRLLSEPDLNVIAFKVDEALQLDFGASYEFAHQMQLRKFTLNTLRDDAVHFCITSRFISDSQALVHFETACSESLDEVIRIHGELRGQGKKFSGDAGMYCDIEASLHPKWEKLTFAKWVENHLLGKRGAEDAIRYFFTALNNPKYKRQSSDAVG